MKRWLIAAAALVVAGIAAYELLLGNGTSQPPMKHPHPVAAIGSGATAVGVSADGVLLKRLPGPKEGSVPRLPISTPPAKHRLEGSALQQVRVLGAAPPALLAHVEKTFYGESGVDVVLRSGIELRFGDASQARRKWRAAAAVLADPTTTALDYVDLRAPGRPAIWGSGHALPPSP